MQIKVHVKTNDNGNIEEWWPAKMVYGDCLEHIKALFKALRVHRELVALLISWNNKLEARIERLEAIISSMAAGSESSPPDDGNPHTHWVYPMDGQKDLVDEIDSDYPPDKSKL